MEIKYIFFDLGNTLTESYNIRKSFSETIFKNIDNKKMSTFAKLFEQIFENEDENIELILNWKELFRKLLIESNISILDSELDDFVIKILTEYTQKCKLASYSKELLDYLLLREKTVSFISNVTGPTFIFNDHLKKMNIFQCFSSIVWSSSIGFRKPSIEIFNYAINQVKANINKSIFIGDSEKADIIGAKKIGMKAILLTNNSCQSLNSKADWVVQKNNIVDFIKNMIEEKMT